MRAFLFLLINETIIMSTSVYHGSSKDVKKLIPELNDKQEKQPILACLDREKAVLKGLEMLLGETHKVKQIEMSDKQLLIELEDTSSILTRSMLEKMSVFLYTSAMNSKTNWMRIVENNQLTDCVSTLNDVLPTDKARIRINLWLSNKRVIIRHARF